MGTCETDGLKILSFSVFSTRKAGCEPMLINSYLNQFNLVTLTQGMDHETTTFTRCTLFMRSGVVSLSSVCFELFVWCVWFSSVTAASVMLFVWFSLLSRSTFSFGFDRQIIRW